MARAINGVCFALSTQTAQIVVVINVVLGRWWMAAIGIPANDEESVRGKRTSVLFMITIAIILSEETIWRQTTKLWKRVHTLYNDFIREYFKMSIYKFNQTKNPKLKFNSRNILLSQCNQMSLATIHSGNKSNGKRHLLPPNWWHRNRIMARNKSSSQYATKTNQTKPIIPKCWLSISRRKRPVRGDGVRSVCVFIWL